MYVIADIGFNQDYALCGTMNSEIAIDMDKEELSSNDTWEGDVYGLTNFSSQGVLWNERQE